MRAALALCLLCPGLALAEGLAGRTVLFNAGTWDDPAEPYLIGPDYAAVVGDGPEFRMEPQGYAGLDIVPVLIDVSEDRVVFTYPDAYDGWFAVAQFNGYVLNFPAECTLIEGASIDPATTLPIDDGDLTVEPQRLLVNLSGLQFSTATRIEIALDVTDCLLG